MNVHSGHPVGYRPVGENRFREVVGFSYEDLTVGTVIEHRPGRTVTEMDNVLMSMLSMNASPLHIDAAFCEKGPWGRPLVSSLVTLSIVAGMAARGTSGKAVANLGWDHIRLTRPVFVGDTLYAESERWYSPSNAASWSRLRRTTSIRRRGTDDYRTSQYGSGPRLLAHGEQRHTERADNRPSLRPTRRLSRRALGAALTALVERHPALRTRYQRTGDELRQQILPPEPVALPVIPVSEEDLEDALLDWSVRPFDLDNKSGFRPVLFTVTPTHAELLLAIHHAFSDGWSMAVLIRDLGELYRAAVTGTVPDLPPLPADYIEFTRWEREYLADPSTRAIVASWAAEARRAGVEPLLLPTDRPRSNRPSRIGAIFDTTLPVTMAEVAAAATTRRATPFAVLLAVFAALTHDLTGRPVVAPHCAVANRVDARFDNVVGVFTNASWLVIPVADAPSFDDLVTRAVCAVLQRMEVQSVPTPVLKEALGGPFEGTPPRVLFGLDAEPMPSLELHGLAPARAMEVDLPVSRADQSWAFAPTRDGGLTLRVEYATELFDTTTVAAWTERFQELLRTSLATPTTRTW